MPRISVAPNIDPLDLIEFRRGQVRRKEYRPLGRLLKLFFERNDLERAIDSTPAEQRHLLQMVSLDWLKDGPLVGVSKDSQDLLICTAMLHPPDLPDPAWIPSNTPVTTKDGIPIFADPPRVAQRLRDRTRSVTSGRDGEKWVVLQPITQILLNVPGGLGQVKFRADFTGRHTTLLFDPRREEGHLLFGRWDMDVLR